VQRAAATADDKGVAFAEHLIATTRDCDRTLTSPDRAAWLWQRLRLALECVLSVVLMPDHLHLVAPPGLRPQLRAVLSAFTVRYGVRFDIREIQEATTRAIAGRMMRYGFNNAVRAGLVPDPWCWRWSTLRDLAGAAHPIWTPLSQVASTLRVRPEKLLQTVTWTADLKPQSPRSEPVLAATFDGVVASVAAALRVPEPDVASSRIGRTLVVQTAGAIAPPNTASLAERLGCSERTIRRDLASRHPALDAALLCLSDVRLRAD
jgi:hypothetical protein